MIVYNPQTPGVYLSSQIYVSEIDHDPQTSSKIVPAVGSIVSFPGGIIKLVSAVDSITLDSTFTDVIIPYDNDRSHEVVNFGKDCLMLYYDIRQIPTRLTVDNKLVLMGENSVGYRILRTNLDGSTEVISIKLDNNGDVVNNGGIIPITETSVNHILVCANGYTNHTLTDGELVKMEVIDSAGTVTMEIHLITKQSAILNTLALAYNPIVGFDAECSQIVGNDWVLYLDQNPNEISIYPYMSYADGSKQMTPVDNMNTFMYGFDAIITDFPGAKYEILIKHFLGPNDLATIDQVADNTRFVTLVKTLVIDALEKYTYSKLIPVPVWNTSNSTYSLRWLAYYETRNSITDVTNLIEYVAGFSFINNQFNTEQEIQVTVPYTNQNGTTAIFTNTFWLTLTTPGSIEPFLIKSSVNGIAYGSQNANYSRPRLMYDTDLQQYFIPSVVFPTAQSFLTNFYYNASPPWLTTLETQAPVPTHFTIRNSASLNTILMTPIPIEQYNGIITLISPTVPSAFVDGTVIVEFLTATVAGYNVLYGVPVEVFTSITGYVG